MSQALTSSHISLHALSLTVGRMLSTCHPLGNGTHSTALEGVQTGQERAPGPCRLVCPLAVRAWSPGGSQEPGKCKGQCVGANLLPADSVLSLRPPNRPDGSGVLPSREHAPRGMEPAWDVSPVTLGMGADL